MELCRTCGAYWECDHRAPVIPEASFIAIDDWTPEMKEAWLSGKPLAEHQRLVVSRMLDGASAIAIPASSRRDVHDYAGERGNQQQRHRANQRP